MSQKVHGAAVHLEPFALGTRKTHSFQSVSLKNSIAPDRVHSVVQLIGVLGFETKQRFVSVRENFVPMVAEGKSMSFAYL